jgi:chorismate mutase
MEAIHWGINQDIWDLLKERFKIVILVWIYKKQRWISPLDKKRWEEVLIRVTSLANESRIPKNLIRDIWNQINDTALILEENTEVWEAEIDLEQIRLQINQIDSKIIISIWELFREVWEQKTKEAVREVLNKISEVV